jgi:hypothetical protein
MKIAIVAFAFLVIVAVAMFMVASRRRGIAIADEEVRALSWAIENYKNDRGHYPTDPATTERLKPNGTFDTADYIASSAFLYRALSGSETGSASEANNHLAEFGNLSRWTRKSKSGETYLVDEWWGNCLGYSTFKAVHPESSEGNNPTFDLWSTGGDQRQPDILRWIKNW